MMIQVNQESQSEYSFHFELSTEKKTAYVGVSKSSGHVNVCCYNAMHKAWGGMGRTFRSFGEAKAAYKSPDMRAIIDYAESAIQKEVEQCVS